MKYTLKPTPGVKKDVSVIKKKVKNYKDRSRQYTRMKEIRIQLEKARIICSQVSRREKTKMKVELMNQEIFRGELDELVKDRFKLGLLEDPDDDLIFNHEAKKRGRKLKDHTENASSSPSRFERLDRTFNLFKGVTIPLDKDIHLKVEEPDNESTRAPIEQHELPLLITPKDKGKRKSKISLHALMDIERSPSSAKTNSKTKSSEKKKSYQYIKKTNEVINLENPVVAQLYLNEEGREVQAKKKRGRPRLTDKQRSQTPKKATKNLEAGSNNQKKTPKKKTPTKSSESNIEETPKKKRGRPRKVSEETPKPKKKVQVQPSTPSTPKRQSSAKSRDKSPKESKGHTTLSSKKKVKKSSVSQDSLITEIAPNSVSIEPSHGNPNEPSDTMANKPPKLKKELQRILQNQNLNQFSVFSASTLGVRTTRKSFKALNSKRASRSKSAKKNK